MAPRVYQHKTQPKRKRTRVRKPGLSEELRQFLNQAETSSISYESVLRGLSRSSHSLLLIIFSFPLCFPVGIPVVTTLLGLMCATVGLFLFLDKPPWIPQKLRSRSISPTKFSKQMRRVLRVTLAAEKVLHPRLSWIAGNGIACGVHGLYVFVLGLIAAIPLPLPLGNFVAAFPVLLMGLGLAEKDGLVILLAYFAGIPCFLYYGALAFLGLEGVEHLMKSFSQLS